MINEKEKEYYNKYLAISRSSRNKAFKLRQNFDEFEGTKEHTYIRRICSFFAQVPQIKPDIFFKAPFELYKDMDYIELKYFTTRKAVNVYSIYMKQLQEESPDSEHHINFIKDSLRFIGMFCIKNNIPLEKYITHSAGTTYSWMKHVKEHNISLYVTFDFENIFDIIGSTPQDELDLLLGEIPKRLGMYKNRYGTSKHARHVVVEGMKRIKRVIDKSVNKGE